MLLESPESASPSVTRAVSAGLRGKYSESFILAPWQRPLLKMLGYLPQGAARYVMSRFNALSGIDPHQVNNLMVSQLIQTRLEDYHGVRGPFPAIITGAAMGGASAHLSLALGGPFLPQAFVLTLKKGSYRGSTEEYLMRSKDLAIKVSESNPGIITIQHFDPVHDEWVVRYANHLRLKLIDLPSEYKEFIHRNLEPGGAVCILDSRASWLRYQLDERSYLQVGGWGDISPEEFLSGSERIGRFCRDVGYTKYSWALDGYPLETGPESEWGCEPGLSAALEDFCHQEGFRFVRISLPDPFDYSRLAFRTVMQQLSKSGLEPAGVLVESFGQFDATAILRSGLLPVWLIFNTLDNLRYLQSIRPQFPPDKPVFFSPLVTFTVTPDIVSREGWQQALEGLAWKNIGARPSHYPADLWAILNWAQPLRRWVEEHPQLVRLPLKAEELLELSQAI